MTKHGSPIQQAWAWNIFSLFLLTLFMPLPIYALWEQYVSQPAWERDGVRTIGVIVDMREKVIQKGHHMEVWVEHRPGGGSPTYRNWIDGGHITRLTGTTVNRRENGLRVGDKLEILYRPGDPQGEAILPQDLQPKGRVLNNRSLIAGIVLGLWLGFLFMASILRMVSRKETPIQDEI